MVNYGLIGCGMMGQEHIRNLALLDGTQVVAIVEPDPEMRRAAQALAPNAVFPESIESLLAAPGLDAIVIASPNHCHVAQLQEISRIRHVPILLEKPVLTDPADVSAIRHFAAGYTAPVWVAMEYRYMPPIAEMLRQLDDVTGGPQMISIREHRFPFLHKVDNWNRFNRNSGGTFVEKCCHFFDLMRLIAKSEPVRVMAIGGQANNHLDETYDGAVPDIWDHGYVIVEFANNVRAMLELCMFAEGARYQEEISVVGASGKVACFVPGPGRFWPADAGPAPVAKLVKSPRTPGKDETVAIPVDETLLSVGDHNGSTYYQHQGFLDVVNGTGKIDVTLEDGLLAVAIGMAAQRSVEEGRAVNMSEILETTG